MFRRDADLFTRELKLRARAGQVMSELKARGEDWQLAWRDHPVAIAYRALLKEAWGGPALEGCEWNPERSEPAEEGDPHALTSPATWSVGTGERNLHLCDACASLPRFERMRHRVRLRAGHPQAEQPGGAA
jgi:hypothetical protein